MKTDAVPPIPSESVPQRAAAGRGGAAAGAAPGDRSPIEPPAVSDEVMKVAFLLTEGKSQKEVCALLNGPSQPQISRLAKMAREANVIVDCPRWNLSEEERQRMSFLWNGVPDLDERLSALAGDHALQVHVFDSRPGADQTDNGETRRSRFAVQVASHLLEHVFPHARVMGVSWGRTIDAVLMAVQQARPPKGSSDAAVTIIPIAGEPLTISTDVRHSASSHAALLHEILNGSAGERPPSLSGVPASIHASDTKEYETIWRFVKRIKAYCQIFGDDGFRGRRGGAADGERGSLIEQVDTILTSVGPADPDKADDWLKETAASVGGKPADLQKVAYGNVSGVYLKKPNLGKDQVKLVAGINERWTGIKEKHLETVAKTARQTVPAADSTKAPAKRPGVVVLATGAEKREIVIECVRCGLVNTLLLDAELARAILQRLPKSDSDAPPGVAAAGTRAAPRSGQ